MFLAVILVAAAAGALRAQPADLPLLEMDLRRVFPALTFTEPVLLTHAGDGSGRIFVAERAGVVKVFANRDDVATAAVFLDISAQTNTTGGETGLLGLAFHPRYADNGLFYIYHTRDGIVSRLAEYRVSAADPDRADPASERVVLDVEQPTEGHNGGSVEFGPDGMLYWGLGDGSGANDAFRNGQDPTTLLATILRIDVDSRGEGLAYGIPPDNPFVGNADGWREEIWAYGLRNPWRFSFDPAGRLWVGDVGQSAWEEIDLIVKGGNYGWSTAEGQHCFLPPEDCSMEGLIPPVVEYGRDLGSSVIGGYTYQSPRLRRLQGVYIYGDFGSRRVWGLRYGEDGILQHAQIAVCPANMGSFGQDEQGEVYIVNVFTGEILAFDEQPGNEPPPITAVAGAEALPAAHRLAQNFPNPFNSATRIDFALAAEAPVRLEVFDLLGRRVATLAQGRRPAGDYRVAWDGRDAGGRALAGGIYLYRLRAGDFAQTRKLVLLK